MLQEQMRLEYFARLDKLIHEMSAQDNFLMQLQAEEQRSKRGAELWRKKKDKE
jgi:hypothetical protein